MSEPWDSPEWVAATAAAAVGVDLGDATLGGTVEVVVPPTAGRPRRPPRRGAGSAAVAAGADTVPDTVRVRLTVTDGVVVDWGAGEAATGHGPLVTFTLPAPDARVALDGTEPSVLYMQGRLKVDGDLRAALAVLAASASPAYRSALEARRG